jgi:hypothetical protein
MGTGRLSQGQTIAAFGGVALLVSTFLPWIGAAGHNENLWKEGSTLDIYLLITGIVALIPALLALTDAAEEFSFVSAATFLLGVVGTILVVAFLTVDFPDVQGLSSKFGCWLGLAAVIVIAFGGFRAMQEEVAGEI